MRKLQLQRPIAQFDIESTGLNVQQDRIIDLAIVVLHPGGGEHPHTWRVNPGIPIPAGATAVHGIRDEDVRNCPSFSDVAEDVARVLDGCDLAGFNVLGYDIPLLQEEFNRTQTVFSMEGRHVVDVQRIFHQMEPRDLSAALRFYCGDTHEGAHGALADVQATLRVLTSQLERYPDLPLDVQALADFCHPRRADWVDGNGRFLWQDGQVVCGFGKYRGQALKDLVAFESGFLRWILKKDFPSDTKELVENAIKGVYPSPPEGAGSLQ